MRRAWAPPYLVTGRDDRNDLFAGWLRRIEQQYLADLTFPEVARALRALSSTYVERRGRLSEGAALTGAGKRAAFALFYGPLHYLLVRRIVETLPQAAGSSGTLLDLGCGTGAAGAAWAGRCAQAPRILGIDRHPWALTEAARTYRDFGLPGHTRQGDISTVTLPKSPASVLAAFTLNEMPAERREPLLQRLVEGAGRGDRLLVVEPIAGTAAPWWNTWRDIVVERGGRADEWRFQIERPALVAKLDRAVGMDHRELTGRSLWLYDASRPTRESDERPRNRGIQ